MTLKEKSLFLHRKYKGKIEIKTKIKMDSQDVLSWAYSPGVAEPCRVIANNPNEVDTYTNRGNTIAIVTDGSAVLGLGNIGPKAALPVMEGKAALFKSFGGVDAMPICLDTQDPDEIIQICKALAPTFGGINLEDISAPKCMKILDTLERELDIPVFHDDQDGTAIVVAAALINSAILVNKGLNSLEITLCGTGAAGNAIARLLKSMGIHKIYAYNKDGVIQKANYDTYDYAIQGLIDDNIIDEKPGRNKNTLADLIENTDVFIGVSVGDLVTESMIKSMNDKPIVFAMANPDPEIDPIKAHQAGACIVGTGRSDFPNQINNVLVFPGIFKGALGNGVRTITNTMKMNAAKAIASIISRDELTPEYVIPSPFDKRVVLAVSKAIKND